MAETHAGNYYRGAGFNGIAVRDRPGVWRAANQIKVHREDLKKNDIVELVVHPELSLRSSPWQFWGQVLELGEDAIILRQISGKEANTNVRIPYRYFDDERVYRTEGYL
jgi:hypothetical protein